MPRYADRIREHLVDIKPDGSFRLDMSRFTYATGLTMTGAGFAELFDGPARRPESELTQREMDLAASVQVVTEEILLRLARGIRQETGLAKLCLAGGVALNCVANGRLLREGIFEDLWIQPAAGDAGGALGAALAVWHQYLEQPREPGPDDAMRGSYLGPAWSDKAIAAWLDSQALPYEALPEAVLMDKLAGLLDGGAVVGWFQGRMEFGPRALGGRSILGDARSQVMQSQMNLKIKYRESFRPFAPAVLAECAGEWFELDRPSPYMLIVADVHPDQRLAPPPEADALFGIDKLNVPRSRIPAVTHVDGSARVQTVSGDTNPRFRALLAAFAARAGCPVLVNTSFNVCGEPIVHSPEEAWRCFMRTQMDYLVLGNCLLAREGQPALAEQGDWREQFELD